MKNSQFFIEVDRAKTLKRKCHHCGDPISEGTKYLHMRKNHHLFSLCGKCLILITTTMGSNDSAEKTKTPNRSCHSCVDPIPAGTKHLYVKRNKHVFTLCSKCLLIYATKVAAHDPVHKADATVAMI